MPSCRGGARDRGQTTLERRGEDGAVGLFDRKCHRRRLEGARFDRSGGADGERLLPPYGGRLTDGDVEDSLRAQHGHEQQADRAGSRHQDMILRVHVGQAQGVDPGLAVA